MRTIWKYKRDASFFPLSAHERIRLSRLCGVARRLDDRLAIPATSSNFSVRASEASFLISRSGIHKRLLTPEHFIRTDLDGCPLHPMAPKPSDETLLHALLYRAFPKAGAIVHCHAPELEKARAPRFVFEGHELLKALGAPSHEVPFELAVFPNSQDMAALAASIEARLLEPGHSHGFVLEKHGIYVVGENVEKALMKLEALLHLLATQATSADAKPTDTKPTDAKHSTPKRK